MFKKSTIIIGIILLLMVGILVIVGNVGILGDYWRTKKEVKIPEAKISEEQQEIKTPEKQIAPIPEKIIVDLKNKITAYPWDVIRRRQIYEEKFIFPDELLKEVILRHIIEKLDLFYYLARDKISLSSVESVEMAILEIDLNEDNVLEYIITESNIKLTERGNRDLIYLSDCGTGGCPIYIFGFVEGKWKLIGELWGFWRGLLKDRRVEGYSNLVTFIQSGAGRGEYHLNHP